MVLQKLVDWWKLADLPETISRRLVGLIVPISYTTKRDQLTEATKENLATASRWLKKHPSARLAFSNCAYTFPGAARVEQRLKLDYLKRLGNKVEFLLAGDMNNSVEEALQIRSACDKEGSSPRRILIITGEMHSRSARLIWRWVFPEAEILVSCTSYRCEAQSDHPVRVQRSCWKWFAANVARQVLLRVLGLKLARFHHRTS